MSDIEKLAVFDDRIVQARPRFAVEKGAVSLTNVPFSAIAQNGSQQTYQIQVPSENVFVDRAVDWTSTCYLQFTVDPTEYVNGDPVCMYGLDFALAQFPLHTLVQTLSATINDTTTTMNTSDVLREVLRLTDSQKNRLQRTCPTYPDTYQNYNDAFGTINNPIGGYNETSTPSEVKNGAYWNVSFTKPDGSDLSGSGTYTSGAYTVDYTNGVPVYNSDTLPAGGTALPIFFRFTSTEKIVLSPFVFADTHANDTGLFGIQNIQLVMNFGSPSFTGLNYRVLRTENKFANQTTFNPDSLSFNKTVANPFGNSKVNVQFLTPSLDLPLPPRSIVPYMEFPRYVSQLSDTINAGSFISGVQSQTITLPSIPDMMIIYAKPLTYGAEDADWYLPITKISVNFDNYAGLLSSHTSQELYSMSISNGLVMDYNQWAGKAYSLPNGLHNQSMSTLTPLTGGFLVLKPSKDITLSTGQAPSLVGNFTFQFQCEVNNNTDKNVVGFNLWVITANSGFFESVKGSSRIVKGVLDERSILSAPPAELSRNSLDRMVGGSKLMNMMGNALSKVKHMVGHFGHGEKGEYQGQATSGKIGNMAEGHKGSYNKINKRLL
jgi:hypothetical protein